jgi:hypothetical protein
MKMRFFLFFSFLSIVISFRAFTKTRAKSHKVYFQLLEAYTQRTLPGMRDAAPQTSTHFIIIWDDKQLPQSFFWRGDSNGWVTCNVVRAHKVTGRPINLPTGIDYMKEVITVDKIQKGDTLELTPVAGGKFPVPAEIPESTRNTLFFKTGGSKLIAFPVKNIGRKQDIAMP